MKQSFLQRYPDFAGMFTSLLCAVHCSAVPVLISMGALGSSTWLHNHAFDWVVIGIGIIIAGYSLVGAYFRKHRNIRPLLLASAGFVLLLIGMAEHHGWMLIFSVLGGITVAYAHLQNHKLVNVCCQAK
ncbi:MAG TPA: MerC domain-containing protein [Saprospiraceae bacterium]|nr:MerC domain-containing protein [Saprospiraceae bacterium]HRO09198.1 MerC domain-containing protein [Saprospiraceae bacterium]HRP42508.1 MerC domain-containing protein [Saprospiraceae bacterium]